MIVEEPASFADPTPLEIVGVVQDAVYRSVREPVPPTMYWPLAQQARPQVVMALMVRVRAGAIAPVSRAASEAIYSAAMTAAHDSSSRVRSTCTRE